MKKIDKVVVKETIYIAMSTLLMSVLMESVFLILDKWTPAVLFGNILGYIAAVGNFFLMGLTVQNAMTLEGKAQENRIKLSQMGRLFLLFAVAAVGCLVSVFEPLAVLIPYLFPRIAIMFRPLIKKQAGGKNE